MADADYVEGDKKRGRNEASETDGAPAASGNPGDEHIACKDCGADFIHSVEDQAYFKEKGYDNKPVSPRERGADCGADRPARQPRQRGSSPARARCSRAHWAQSAHLQRCRGCARAWRRGAARGPAGAPGKPARPPSPPAWEVSRMAPPPSAPPAQLAPPRGVRRAAAAAAWACGRGGAAASAEGGPAFRLRCTPPSDTPPNR